MSSRRAAAFVVGSALLGLGTLLPVFGSPAWAGPIGSYTVGLTNFGGTGFPAPSSLSTAFDTAAASLVGSQLTIGEAASAYGGGGGGAFAAPGELLQFTLSTTDPNQSLAGVVPNTGSISAVSIQAFAWSGGGSRSLRAGSVVLRFSTNATAQAMTDIFGSGAVFATDPFGSGNQVLLLGNPLVDPPAILLDFANVRFAGGAFSFLNGLGLPSSVNQLHVSGLVDSVPEPTPLGLLLASLVGLVLIRGFWGLRNVHESQRITGEKCLTPAPAMRQ